MMFAASYYSCTKDQGKIRDTSCDSLLIKYLTDIQPIIQSNGCAGSISCHFIGSKAGDFTDYAGISTKADAPLGNGSLRKRIVNGYPPVMPPSGALPDSMIKKFDCWLKDGAPDN